MTRLTFASGCAASLFAAVVLLSPRIEAQETSPRTIWDKVYTETQAARGKNAYAADCAACHGDDLGGIGYAPALSGDEFTAAWTGKTVGDFVERIQKLMPPESPGSLPLSKYRDITAFLLQANKVPAGEAELDGDLPALRQIKVVPQP